MEEKEQAAPASEEQEETSEEETQEEETTEKPEQQEGESVEDYKARLQKAEELAENYKKRAEKAEKQAKAPKVQTKELSQADLLFLAKSDIHEDDIEDVTTWARNNSMSVKDAYTQFKPVLDTRAEERKTAAATNTKSARGTKSTSGEDLLKKAEQTGEAPTDEAGIKAIVDARFERRKSQA